MTPVQITVIIIDLIGIAIGVGAVVLGLNLKKTIGGRVGEGLTYFMWGVVWMVLAFVYTLFNARFNTVLKGQLNLGGVDIHHALMTLGMIFFIVSARKFTRLAKE